MAARVWPPKIHINNHGTAYVRLWEGGKPRNVSLGKANTPAAARRYREVVAAVEAHGGTLPPAPTPDLTIRELAAAWVASAPRRYRPDSREPREVGRAAAVLLDLYGDTPARSFGPKALKQVRQAMASAGLSRRVVNRRITRLKTVFKWGTEEELIPGGVYEALRAVRALPPHSPGVREGRPKEPATWSTVKALIRHVSAPVRAMLLVQWFTGMRSGEVRRMRPLDLDRAGDVWLYRPGSDAGPHGRHKNAWRGQARVVAVPRKAQLVLRRWLRLAPHPGAYLFDPRHVARGRARKDHYTDSAYGLAAGRAAWKAGLRFRPYWLRDGFRMAAARLMGDEAARAALGQKSIDTTQHYGRIDVDLAAELARRVG